MIIPKIKIKVTFNKITLKELFQIKSMLWKDEFEINGTLSAVKKYISLYEYSHLQRALKAVRKYKNTKR